MTKPTTTTKTASKQPAGKVFDVRRPGRAPASSTSRPVIVGHKPEVQDSVAGVSGIGDAPRQQLLSPKKKVGVRPITIAEAAPTQEQAAAPVQEPTPSPVSASIPSSVPPLAAEAESLLVRISKPAPVEPTVPIEASKPAEQTVVTQPQVKPVQATAPVTSVEQTVASTPPEKAMATAPVQAPDAPKPAAPEPTSSQDMAEPASEPWLALTDATPDTSSQVTTTVAEPEYEIQPIVVSHHRSPNHVWKVVLLLLVIVLLAAAALDILLDAQIIAVPGLPHTSFF
jgi:hypothetical protein